MAKERITSKIAHVNITITGVWNDEEGNPYIIEEEYFTSIDTEGVTEFDEFKERAASVAEFLIDHPKVCTSIMKKND